MTKNGVFWIAIIILALSVWSVAKKSNEHAESLSYSEFLQQVDKDNVREVRMDGSSIYGEYRNTSGKFQPFMTVSPKDDTLVPKLVGKGVNITVQEDGDQSSYLLFLVNALPMILLLGVWFYSIP